MQDIPALLWEHAKHALDTVGHAVLPGLLSSTQCATLAGLYRQEQGFRSRVVMARHGFGRGEYKYFDYPLPPLVDKLRSSLYPPLAHVANLWNQRLGIDLYHPATLADFLALCHAGGQTRPTPLLLEYGEGDYNCLHQDLYGPLVFPLQVAILLSQPDRDFTGGEFVMTQDSRGHQRADVVPLQQGDAVVFAVNHRPEPGARGGFRRVATRHGVSRLHSGRRHTLGVIFHDAP